MEQLVQEFEQSKFWQFFGMECVSVSEEEVVLRLPYQEGFENARQTIHGGVYMALIDTAMGMLARARGNVDAPTIQMTTHFLKPAIAEPLIAKAQIVEEMRSTALLQGRLYNEAGDVLAYCNATFRTVKPNN